MPLLYWEDRGVSEFPFVIKIQIFDKRCKQCHIFWIRIIGSLLQESYKHLLRAADFGHKDINSYEDINQDRRFVVDIHIACSLTGVQGG